LGNNIVTLSSKSDKIDRGSKKVCNIWLNFYRAIDKLDVVQL